jgi:arylsulfatase
MRTGLLKVGLPGAKEGLSDKDPTLAELLKPLGYMTGNSARTILATATSSCPPFMASMSSSAIFTT